MASTKKSTIPGPKTDDLTISKLPGGGVAKWFKPGELTPRRERPLTVLTTHMMPKMRAAVNAANVGVEGDVADVNPFDVQLSLDDVENMLRMQELAAVTYLKSWSRDEPVPTEADQLLDLPSELYNALIGHATQIQATLINDAFTVDGVEDPDSPTGGSGD